MPDLEAYHGAVVIIPYSAVTNFDNIKCDQGSTVIVWDDEDEMIDSVTEMAKRALDNQELYLRTHPPDVFGPIPTYTPPEDKV